MKRNIVYNVLIQTNFYFTWKVELCCHVRAFVCMYVCQQFGKHFYFCKPISFQCLSLSNSCLVWTYHLTIATHCIHECRGQSSRKRVKSFFLSWLWGFKRSSALIYIFTLVGGNEIIKHIYYNNNQYHCDLGRHEFFIQQWTFLRMIHLTDTESK